jgi:RNA polymerase sigma-70 factor (ECF subfamily)
MLMRFLQRNKCNAAEIADLSQEAYARVYEAAQRERPHQVKPFLFQVARNLMIDRLRKQSVVSLEAMADFEWLNIPDDKPTSEQTLVARQELRLLQAALHDLPPRCRQVVMMRRLLAQAMSGRRGAVTTASRRYSIIRKPRDVR